MCSLILVGDPAAWHLKAEPPRRSTNESDRDFLRIPPRRGATVNSRVRVTLETGEVVTGVIVEDFGELIPTGGSVEATIDDERGAARLRRF